MAVKNSGHALLHLQTLFNVGAIGALSDGQLLEQFATGRGEPRELADDDDLEKIIHEEIGRLPGRLRVAVVLCDLEGRTHEQAARHLGCAVGTVKSLSPGEGKGCAGGSCDGAWHRRLRWRPHPPAAPLERLCRQAWQSRRSLTRQRRAPFQHRSLSLPKES